MRKSILAMLLLMSMLLVLCAACGGDDAPVASVSATMAPTAEPVVEAEVIPAPEAEVTPEPVEEEPAEEQEPVEEEPVQEPEEEADEPAQKPQESTGNNSGNTQSKPEPTAKPTPEPTAEPEVDKFAVAQKMTGSMVQDLYAAIGQPNGADYTTSCLVFDGQDGLLYYDGFTVSTVKYADGTEMVMGAY